MSFGYANENLLKLTIRKVELSERNKNNSAAFSCRVRY